MRIGIFGGSFNPPHNMHEDIVLELLRQKYLDKIICVPTGDDYAKSYLLPITNRIEMLKRMFEDNEAVEISDIESTGFLYTWETMNYYGEKYPEDEIFFICGMDNLAELSTWHMYEEILENYKLIVVKRETEESEAALEMYKKYIDRIEIANIKARSVSSTCIRNEIIKNGFSSRIHECMDERVINYLKKIEYGKYWNTK